MSETVHITQKNQIRGLSKAEFSLLREMCRSSKNLYNVALYNIRQQFFAGNNLSYESNYHLFKENENYKLLQAGVAQQTAKQASEAFNSFLALKQLVTLGKYPSKAVKIPDYLPMATTRFLCPLMQSTLSMANWSCPSLMSLEINILTLNLFL